MWRHRTGGLGLRGGAGLGIRPQSLNRQGPTVGWTTTTSDSLNISPRARWVGLQLGAPAGKGLELNVAAYAAARAPDRRQGPR